MRGFRCRLHWVVAATLAALASACTVDLQPKPQPRPQPPRKIGERPPRHERLAALFSIYYHAVEASLPADRGPREVEPLEPATAAKILQEDQTDIGESRRRHAVAQLAVADIDRPDFREAMLILLQRGDGQVPVGDARATLKLIEIALDANVGLDPPGKQGLLVDLFDALFGPVFPLCMTRCKRTELSCEFGGKTTAVATLRVLRPYDTVARGFDPQSWDDCSDFFPATYVAEQVSGSYPIDSQHNGIPDPFPPLIGTGWDAVLFEHFEMAWGPLPISWFKNFLNIDGTLDTAASTWSIEYDLRKSIRSSVFGIQWPNGIQTDEGIIKVSQSGSWSSVRAEKTIKFTSRSLNTAACALLSAMADASAELACCTPP